MTKKLLIIPKDGSILQSKFQTRQKCIDQSQKVAVNNGEFIRPQCSSKKYRPIGKEKKIVDKL